MIRVFLFLSFSFGFTSYLAKAQDTPPQIIKKLMAEQQDAWNSGDLEGFMESYWQSDSLMFIGSRGVTYGWQQTLDNYRKSYPDQSTMGELSFGFAKIEVLSDSVCFVIGTWELKRKKDRPGGYFTLLWRKIDEEWVIVADHSS